MSKITVIGSLNVDIVTTVDRLPKIGETILGEEVNYYIGGKGANQAVAASRFGSEVTMLGKVGDDTFGSKILKHLGTETIDISKVIIEKNIFTGTANVFKLPVDNLITVVQGANGLVDEGYLAYNREEIEKSSVLLTQLEIPIDTVGKALKIAKDKGVITVLNPAPFRQEVLELIDLADYITPNETEFESIYGCALNTKEAFEAAMVDWSGKHKTKLIVTRGSLGTSTVRDEKVITIPTFKTNVVDTTGAGDTFNGIFASEIGDGKDVENAMVKAVIGATLSVQHLGAQPGIPYKDEVENALNKTS